MPIRRLIPNQRLSRESLNDYFVNGERVYKLDSIIDQIEGRFVHLSLTPNALLLLWKYCKGNEVINLESCYIDDIIDVFFGCCAENSRRKRIDQKVTKIYYIK
ncbi:unnamed protein product [Thelazia callipaeda]|uniref:DUF4158 domain-containing protein n=1 Tax=Thelazia callipaeda TaxID=103827 RepID=A0A0N5DC78_THECL|nr:unnamed protein product [Thelazia callipaeda]